MKMGKITKEQINIAALIYVKNNDNSFTLVKDVIGYLPKHRTIDNNYLESLKSKIKAKYDTSSWDDLILDITNDKNIRRYFGIEEELMENITISNWKDLDGYVICKDSDMVDEKQKRRSYCGCIFKVDSLEKCVNIMNTLGGNFEYREMEIIDTHKKLFNFICMKEFNFKPKNNYSNTCYFYSYEDQYNYSEKEVEEKFNVDLKILKEN